MSFVNTIKSFVGFQVLHLQSGLFFNLTKSTYIILSANMVKKILVIKWYFRIFFSGIDYNLKKDWSTIDSSLPVCTNPTAMLKSFDQSLKHTRYLRHWTKLMLCLDCPCMKSRLEIDTPSKRKQQSTWTKKRWFRTRMKL